MLRTSLEVATEPDATVVGSRVSSGEERKRNGVRAVRSKNSKIELMLRSALWNRGLRYRLHVRDLVGTPDIVFSRARLVIFVDSEFWHGYDWERHKKDFRTNADFWIPKIERNMARDIEVTRKLEECGWCVIRFWGNEIERGVELCAQRIVDEYLARISSPSLAGAR